MIIITRKKDGTKQRSDIRHNEFDLSNRPYQSLSSEQLNKLIIKGIPEAIAEKDFRALKNNIKRSAMAKSIKFEKDNRIKLSYSDMSIRKERLPHFEIKQKQLQKFIKKKSEVYFDDMTYGPDELKEHFDKCFLFWKENFGIILNNENYGTAWHVDHVIPRTHKMFHNQMYRKPLLRATRKCFDINNLRPTPAIYNEIKGSYYYKDKVFYWKKHKPTKDNFLYEKEQNEALKFVHICEELYEKYMNSKKKRNIVKSKNKKFVLLKENFNKHFIKEQK